MVSRVSLEAWSVFTNWGFSGDGVGSEIRGQRCREEWNETRSLVAISLCGCSLN